MDISLIGPPTIWVLVPLPDWRVPKIRSAGFVALVGLALCILGLAFAAEERASAAACWDPTMGWRCNQSGGSDALFLAGVSTVVALVGAVMAGAGTFAILWMAQDPRNRWPAPPPAAMPLVYPCPRCHQALVWSPMDGRWYCPWCGQLA